MTIRLVRLIETMRQLLAQPQPHKRPIGFVHPKEGQEGKESATGKKARKK